MTKDIPKSCDIKASGATIDAIMVTIKAHFLPEYNPKRRIELTRKAKNWTGFEKLTIKCKQAKTPMLMIAIHKITGIDFLACMTDSRFYWSLL